jgi:hypothetical protein
MSFGASPSDIIIVVTFCKALYRKCRDAGGEYDEISREVRGMQVSEFLFALPRRIPSQILQDFQF